jgi:hypothetical protein
MPKHIRYDVVTAKSHGDAMEYYRQGKEANKPFSFIMMDLTMCDDEGEKSRPIRWKETSPEAKP